MNFLVIDAERQVVAIESTRPSPEVYPPPFQIIPNILDIDIALPRVEFTEKGEIRTIPGTIIPEFSLKETKRYKKAELARVLTSILSEPLEKYSEGQRQGWSSDVAFALSYQGQKTFESAGTLLVRVMTAVGFPADMLISANEVRALIVPEDEQIIHDALNELTLKIISKSEALYLFRALVEGAADKLNLAIDAATKLEELEKVDPDSLPKYSTVAGD